MQSLSEVAPVRHGKCRLILVINGVSYRVKRLRGHGRGSRSWQLVKPGGEFHVVARVGKSSACSCADCQVRNSVCKHQRALHAVGLLPQPAAFPPKGGAA